MIAMFLQVIFSAAILSLASSVELKCYQCNDLLFEACGDSFDFDVGQRFLRDCRPYIENYRGFKSLASKANCTAEETIASCKLKAETFGISFPELIIARTQKRLKIVDLK